MFTLWGVISGSVLLLFAKVMLSSRGTRDIFTWAFERQCGGDEKKTLGLDLN